MIEFADRIGLSEILVGVIHVVNDPQEGLQMVLSFLNLVSKRNW